jgi:hypothetical protein
LKWIEIEINWNKLKMKLIEMNCYETSHCSVVYMKYWIYKYIKRNWIINKRDNWDFYNNTKKTNKINQLWLFRFLRS